MHFGHKIIIAFVLFISFIISMVFAMVRTRVDLVKEDYYEDKFTFKHNQQIFLNSKAAQEAFMLSESDDSKYLILNFGNALPPNAEGKVYFFRPADKYMDFELNLAINEEGNQRVPTSKLARGLWRVQVEYVSSGSSYKIAKPIYLP
jgi:hypothetical protein